MHVHGDEIKRRDLLRIGLVGPLIAGFADSCEIDKDLSGPDETGVSFSIGDYPALASAGGAARVTLDGVNGGRQLMVIRNSPDSFSVLNAICTHQGCPVNLPEAQDTELSCPCHASKFSISSGDVLSGPAPAPLTVFRSTFDTGTDILTVFG